MLASVADVRPGERRGAAAAFLTLFGILASHTLLETARDALFLARLPPSQLPWVYLAMAAVAIALSQGPWRAPKHIVDRRKQREAGGARAETPPSLSGPGGFALTFRSPYIRLIALLLVVLNLVNRGRLI